MNASRSTTCLVIVVLGSLAAGPTRADKPPVVPPELKTIHYRLISPGAGGRVSRAVGVPGDARTYYAGVAGGGVWKSTDGGILWRPIFDEQPISSIGSLAVAPSDPNVIYVGSGEANIRGNVAAGNGIYKSTDAGKTWQHVWKQDGQIGTMIVHPTNPDIAFAAVLGHAFGPNPERGVYRTTDGGKTWKQVLKKDADTGASDVCFDANNPRILFAGLWQARRRPWDLTSGGPGSGLYTSRDGGDTWKQLGPFPAAAKDTGKSGEGLPDGIWGKVGVAVAPSDSRRVYALIEAEKGGLYRSDDGGEKWELINPGHYLRQRAWYYTVLTIDPKNADVIWVPQVRLLKSIDGGKTFKRVKGPHHGDHHDIWIDPRDTRRMIDSNDGGVDVTTSGGETWFAPRLPISQFYHIAADNRTPYHVMGNMQDLGTAAGPSNSLSSAGIAMGDWYAVGGGETGFAVPDPANPDIVFAGEYGGYLTRYHNRTKQARNVSIYPTNPSGHAAAGLRYRFQWTAPVMVSIHKPHAVYHAANVLFKSIDGGQTWTRISPDLTRNDKSKQQWSGGPITGDNTTAEYYCTIFAIAESPRKEGVLWAGSDDGLVHVTLDGGKTWANVTENIPEMPEWGTVDCIEASPFDAATAYVVVDAHRLDNNRPYLYMTHDYGKTWTSLAGSLPQDVYLHAVREDPKRRGLLYVGTEQGVAFSLNNGARWQQLKLNLPPVGVTDLVVKNDDLVVATNGRSIWILDDLMPIRDSAWRQGEETGTLLPVQPATRWREHPRVYSMNDRYAAKNPPVGAVVHYYLKSKPKDPITLEVRDSEGNLVTRLTSVKQPDEVPEDDPDAPSHPYKLTTLTTEPGINRVVWDLRYSGASHIPHAKIDSGEVHMGPLVTPGIYMLKLSVNGKSHSTRVEVLPDPRVRIPSVDLEAQLKLALELRGDINRLAHMVEEVRSFRTQLQARVALLQRKDKAAPLVKQGAEIIKKLDALESKLHNPKAEVVYDILAQKGGAQLYSLLGFLFESIKEADGSPTEGMREVYAEVKRRFQSYEGELRTLRSGELARFNHTARDLGIPDVIVPTWPKK
jgi:photosystem II stability/assembly factor-like uncharacterized protein